MYGGSRRYGAWNAADGGASGGCDAHDMRDARAQSGEAAWPCADSPLPDVPKRDSAGSGGLLEPWRQKAVVVTAGGIQCFVEYDAVVVCNDESTFQ